MGTSIQWFDWQSVKRDHGRHLPHFDQRGCIYFVTFRLADSVPAELVRRWRVDRDRYIASLEPPLSEQQLQESSRLYSHPMECYLDEGRGAGTLRFLKAQSHVVDVLRHGDGVHYRLGDFVIMPNHVHVLAQLLDGQMIQAICRQWKSISARRINKALERRGELWQKESFDHILRSREHFIKAQHYVQRNPERLPTGTYLLGRGTLHVA